MATVNKNIENIFPLSPMQQALLVNSLREGDDEGLLQIECTLAGDLDEERLRGAWQHVMNSRDALRTSLHWANLPEPLQIVHRELRLPWRSVDLSGMTSNDQEAAIEEFARRDRESGLSLDVAPAFRLAFFRMDAGVGRVLWTCHHAILDGWSGALVIRDVVRAEAALARGTPQAAKSPSYRDYVRWLRNQKSEESRRVWRQLLAGVTSPTAFSPGLDSSASGGRPRQGRKEAVVDETTTLKLSELCRARRFTLGVLFQAAWAVTLRALSRRPDHVVFGATVSGRDVDLPGVDEIAGLFISAIPVIARFGPGQSFSELALRLQAEQVVARRHSHLPLDDIQAVSDVPAHRRLFDSLVVFENYPGLDADDRPVGDGLSVTDFSGGITSNYATTLVVGPGTSTRLHLVIDQDRMSDDRAEEVLRALVEVLNAVAENPEVETADLSSRILLDSNAPVSIADSEGEPGAAPRAAPHDHSVDAFVAPRTDAERRLAGIWQRLLGTQRVSVRDGFFDVGGHSLLALRLIREIDEEFSVRLPVTALFDSPTVEGLAVAIEHVAPVADRSSIVPLKRSGTGTPILCVHSWTGDVVMYRGIAANMGPEYPVLGLQAPGVEGQMEPVERMEDLAEFHTGMILNRWPTGPVALVGRCLSAPLILEISRRLRDAGCSVAAVVNLDSGRPRDLPPRVAAAYLGDRAQPRRSKSFLYYVRRAVRVISEFGLTGLIERVIGRTRRDQVRQGVGEDVLPQELEMLNDPRVAAVVDGLSQAWLNYTEKPSGGTLTLIRSSQNADDPVKDWHLTYWKRYVDELKVHVVPSLHEEMLLEPAVSEVARIIGEAVSEERAHARPATRGTEVAVDNVHTQR